MPRVIWLTDIHLNFIHEIRLAKLIDDVRAERPDRIILTGDIAESASVEEFLRILATAWNCPIDFVLGNHDYYQGSIADVRGRIRALAAVTPNLRYLTGLEVPVSVSPSIALVGHDGWGDGRAGDYDNSLVEMSDYRLIHELIPYSKFERRQVLHDLGSAAAKELSLSLQRALQTTPTVIVATHVPPFREACWHEGRISDDHWAPHFTCIAVGDLLRAAALDYPDRKIVVLCGHTHSAGLAQVTANLTVFTGFAEYTEPAVTRVFDW